MILSLYEEKNMKIKKNVLIAYLCEINGVADKCFAKHKLFYNQKIIPLSSFGA